jgi:hypothetical protein
LRVNQPPAAHMFMNHSEMIFVRKDYTWRHETCLYMSRYEVSIEREVMRNQ